MIVYVACDACLLLIKYSRSPALPCCVFLLQHYHVVLTGMHSWVPEGEQERAPEYRRAHH
jgi:hypothetical protein